MACTIDDKLIEVDPDTGAVMVTAEVNAPEYVTAADQVWAAAPLRTYRVDPESGAVIDTVDGGCEPDGSITQDDEFGYVRNGTDFLIQIDNASGHRVATITSDTATGGGVVIADGDVWAAADDDSALIRLRSEAP